MSLILAFALLGQCPNGQCSRPAVYWRAPVPVQAVPAKRWFVITTRPGWLGYGAMNARGEVVVERWSKIPAR